MFTNSDSSGIHELALAHLCTTTYKPVWLKFMSYASELTSEYIYFRHLELITALFRATNQPKVLCFAGLSNSRVLMLY